MITNICNVHSIPKGEEEVIILYEDVHTRIQRIQSHSHASIHWYDQEESEWVSVLEGWASLELESGFIALKKGDSLLIPPHQKHRIAATSEVCIWLCVYSK